MIRAVDVLLLVSLLLSSRCLAVDPVERDIEYARIGDRSLRLDLYRPSDADLTEPLPLMVWVHGGAWRSGSKESVPVLHWLENGFAIASIDYRLSPEAKFPAQVHDIKAAIRFLRAHAAAYRLDAKKFGIAGASAGGHLAALVGVTAGVDALEGDLGHHRDQDSSVQAIVSFYGASNLQSILGQSTEHGLSVRVPALQLLFGGQPDEQPELAKLASPIAHVDPTDPPLWLVHGDADPQMPFEQSKDLSAAYKQYSLPIRFDVVAAGKHGGPEFYEASRLDSIASEVKASLLIWGVPPPFETQKMP